MNPILQNLINASERIKAEEQQPNHCGWCNSEIPKEDQFCEGADCEYDHGKWRRLNA